MSLSTSSLIFQFSWRPSKHVLVGIVLLMCIALCCLYLSALSLLIKSIIAVLASLYFIVEIRTYYRQSCMQFFSNQHGLQCAGTDGVIGQLNQLQWQDWGYIIVLNAQLHDKHTHWFWLTYQLSELEKREFRLLMRANQKKATGQLPSIATNPVL